MQYLCPNCGSFMEVISTASFPPIITYHCFSCGFKSKPLKETVECEYLPIELWAEAKLADPNYSRCTNDSTRKKLSEAGKKASHCGRKVSEETRRKMSKSHKRRWEKRKNEDVT